MSDLRSPAIISVPPLPISTVVSARLTLSPSIWTSTRVTPLVLSFSDTSVDICKAMRFLSRTVGVKFKDTPNCLNSIITLPVESLPVGTGYSPPARKPAVSPEIAVRLGSASVLTMPFCSNDLSVTSNGPN